MKNAFKKIFIVLFSVIILLTGTAPMSDAASKHMLIINTKKNTLNYYANYTLVKEFRCATGKASTPTPQCKTTIVNKIKNRPYYKKNIPGGDPRNPLGKRWMGLNINGTQGSTYGIHGNNDESSIGKNVSHGCIRMHNADVEWLFDQVTIGTTVLIKNTANSDDYIANYYNIKLIKNGWFTENNKTYYRKSNGSLAKCWNTIDGNRYYFDSKGVMLTGWRTISGNKYYFNSEGVMTTGWRTISGNKYYFNSKGIMLTGWRTIGGNKYYFNSKGVMLTGWRTISGNKYYFNSEGVMTTGWRTISGNKYYFNSKGIMLTGWRTIGGNKYYFNSKGIMLTGWRIIGGNKYYLGTNGVMVTGTKTIDGVVYKFDQNGVLIKVVTEKPPVDDPKDDTAIDDTVKDDDKTVQTLEDDLTVEEAK